jgi:polysaccharide deacetylase family protein (PEP-CTERM system associated)
MHLLPSASRVRSSSHVLSFDVEEYFHVEAAAASVRPEDWPGMESRLAPAVDRVLELLAEHDASATFFILGWLARRQGGLVARIAKAGHEIASHGMSHRMVQCLQPEEFRSELSDSRKLLEDLCSSPVVGYRAPTFSLTHETAWAIDALAEAGYEYDSSVFPVRHDRYGVPNAPRWAHWAVGPAGGKVLEIPPLTLRVLGMNLPVGGGGYLRFFPIRLLGRGLSVARRAGKVAVVYLHPWELDPHQPILPMGRFARWRHRVGLGRTESKLRWLLKRHPFTDFRRCMHTLRSSADEHFTYGRDD